MGVPTDALAVPAQIALELFFFIDTNLTSGKNQSLLRVVRDFFLYLAKIFKKKRKVFY